MWVGRSKQASQSECDFVPPNVAHFHSTQSECTDIVFALPSVAHYISRRKFTAALT